VSLLARGLNVVALAAVIGVLIVLLWFQFARGELPCALCLVQRAAFIAAGLGFLLNVRFGSSESHYGIVIVSAMGGAAVAGRQVLLHIATSSRLSGPVVFGVHFETWALIAFCTIVLFCGAMLFVESQFVEGVRDVRPHAVAQYASWLFVVIALGYAVSALLVCGVGVCAENPTGYQLPWK